MARYKATVESAKTPEEAFDYLADFANAREWDPGVADAETLDPGPVGPGTRFRLGVRILGRSVPLEYAVAVYDRPNRVVLRSDGGALVSVDDIRFTPSGGSVLVTYDADLRLNGPFGRLAEPLLAVLFRRVGARAAAGLRRALNR